MRINGKTYWIVGASQGLGAELARQLHDTGAHLVLSARSEAGLMTLAQSLKGAQVLPMDVTDARSVSAAINKIGLVDGVIYCAALYDPMAAFDWSPDVSLKMIDANYLGAVRVIGGILPQFLTANSGHVVLIGSLSGFKGLPGALGYADSKAAMMALGECLYADLLDTDVKVTMASPGFIRTRLTDKNDFSMPQIMEPKIAARHVIKAMQSRRFHTAFPKPFSWLFTVGRMVPDSWFYRIFT